MSDLLTNLLSGLFGAVLGTIGSLIVYSHGYMRIEAVERRKQKIALLDDLMAARYVLQNGATRTADEARDFNRAMARVPHVFAENREVMACFDALTMGATDSKIHNFFESITLACGLKKYAVSQSHLARVMTVSPTI